MATKFVKYYLCLVEDYGMSQEATLLYCLLRDLLSLSESHPQFHNKHGVPYVVMTVKEVGRKPGCKEYRARKCFNECEGRQLITRVVPVRDSAARIYINPCDWINTTPEKAKAAPQTYVQVLADVYDALEIGHFCRNDPARAGLYYEVAANIAELYTIGSAKVYVVGELRTREDIKAHLDMLTPQHIEGIVENFYKCTDEIKNPKGFLQSCIYNAVSSHHAYYINQVNVDL